MIQTNKQYQAYAQRWDLMRACIEGDDDYRPASINSDKSLVDYLPATFKEDDPERFEVYAERAIYTNYTENTVVGMLGMMMRLEAPVVEVPPNIEYLLEDWDGGGADFDQLQKRLGWHVLSVGRVGVLTEYPKTDKKLTLEQVQQLDLKAKFVIYNTESILDWRTEKVNGKIVLKMVKLKEIVEEWEGFKKVEKEQYRVLALDDAGYYFYQLLDEHDNPVTDPEYPTDSGGSKWDYIPFRFCGSDNNSADVDKPPLYSLAKINLGHFRNSADHEENLFVSGQGTVVIDTGNMTKSQLDESFPAGFKFGTRTAFAGPGFKASMLQIEAQGALKVAMDDKVQQMIQIGAEIIREYKARETAKAAAIDASMKTSKLKTITRNIELTINNCFMDACRFMNADPEAVDIKLNMDFYDESLDPQSVMALIALRQGGDIAQSDLRAKLRRTDWLDTARTDEDIDAEAEVEGII